jgi:hypothetical protein
MFMALSVIIADFDPGTLTFAGILFLTAIIVLICLILGGLAWFTKSRQCALPFLKAALIFFILGICVAFGEMLLTQKGIIHPL